MSHTLEVELPRIAAKSRLDWLDALRGWAILGVVLVHTGQSLHIETGFLSQLTDAGQYGVQLFFIVSALTIGITFESHVARFGPGFRTAVSWLIKRFFRIAPLYYFAILFYAVEQYAIYIESHHQYGHLPNAVPDIIANVVFIHTWVPSANNNIVPGGWSIGVEVFFYLLVPLIWSIPKELRVLFLSLAVFPTILFSVLANVLTVGTPHIDINTFLYYWFPTQYSVFALGLIYFLTVIKPKRQVSTPRNSWLFFVAFMGVYVFGLACGSWKALAPVLSPLFVGLAFICLIISLNGAIKNVLVNPILTFLGRISYSIYIFHFVVLDTYRAAVFRGSGNNFHSPYWLLVVFPAAVLLTSGLAYLSKRFLEDPGINFGHRLSQQILGGFAKHA